MFSLRTVLAPLIAATSFFLSANATHADDALAPTTFTAAELQLHQYFYIDFPRRLQAIDDQTTLAEHEVRLLQERVDGYRPFRSFGRYSAAYTADRLAQLHLLAAQQRLACLAHARTDHWRERQAVVAAYFPQQ
jgi:hypothetical protein